MIRKALLALLFCPISVWAVCTGTDVYSTAICADAPTDYYRLDETSGTTAASIGSNAGSGTYTGGFTLNQATLVPTSPNASVSLNGSTGFIPISSAGTFPNATNNAGWSMEFWTPLHTGGTAFSVSDQANLKQTMMVFDNNPPQVNVEHCSTGDYGLLLGPTLTASTYQLVITTLGGGSNTLQHLRFYVNGGTHLTTLSSFSGALCQPANPPAQIGTWAVSSGNQFFYTGRIDEVSFYAAELTAAQVTTHYNAGVGVSKSGWPYTVKRPELPKFRNDDYFDKLVKYGYHTGQFTHQARMPQFIGFYPTFDVVPNGDVR